MIERVAKLRAQACPFDSGTRAFRAVQNRLCIVQRDIAAARIPQMIQATVAERPEQPESKVGSIPTRRQIDVGAHERVLNHVRGDIVIADHRHGVAVHPDLVTADELGELVDLASEDSAHDDGVVE
jgi:hypothetical protein